MLYEKVERATLLAKAMNPGAEFYIPLEDFMEYVTFHLIVKEKMRNTRKNDIISMREYLKGQEYYAKYNKDTMTEEEYRIVNNIQRNSVNRINTLNHKTKAAAEKRKKLESEKKSSRVRFKNPIKIHKFHVKGEVPHLMAIKENKGPLNTTYNRILNNNSDKVNFINYKLFSENLRESIEKSDLEEDEKKLHYYMIEKSLIFHTLKKISKIYEDMTKSNNPKLSDKELDERLDMMLYATKSPMLQQWTKYIDLAMEFDIKDFDVLITEINSIYNFFKCIILIYFRENNDISFNNSDLIYYRKYVDSKTFENDYKLKKDFSSTTFNTVLCAIEKGNNRKG